MKLNDICRRSVLILAVGMAILAILFVDSTEAINRTVNVDGNPEHMKIQTILEKSGRLEANGIDFQLVNSDYLNIDLESSEPIKLILESGPEMVIMHIEPD